MSLPNITPTPGGQLSTEALTVIDQYTPAQVIEACNFGHSAARTKRVQQVHLATLKIELDTKYDEIISKCPVQISSGGNSAIVTAQQIRIAELEAQLAKRK